jgi:hypothetical protein
LTAANIDSKYLLTATFQEHLGEPAGRGACIERPARHVEPQIVECADEFVSTPRNIVIIGSLYMSPSSYPIIRPLYHRAVDNDLACGDHVLSLAPGTSQSTPDQLAIEALSHCSARLAVVRSIVISSIKRVLKRLVRPREPVVMLLQRRGG